jgi:translocation and assembly module TamB
MTRRRRILVFSLLAAAIVLIAGAAATIWLLRSNWLSLRVRDRIVVEVEKATGGKAEIGSFHFDWKTLTAEVKPFVLHGRERGAEAPLFRADSIEVGLKVLSLIRKRVDLASLIVNRPELNIHVYPDGSTNLPSPAAARASRPILQRFVDLKARHFELRDGIAEIQNQRTRFDVRGNRLEARFDYDAAAPSYRGHVSSRQLRIATDKIQPVALDFDSDVAISGNAIQVTGARMGFGGSSVDANGMLRILPAVEAEFRVRSHLLPRDLAGIVRLPVEKAGEANFDGSISLSYAPEFHWTLAGRLTGRGLAYRGRRVHLDGIGLEADVKAAPGEIDLSRFTASALGGSFTGSAALAAGKRFVIDGDARGFALADAPRLGVSQPLPWSGVAGGKIHAEGMLAGGVPRGLVARADLTIAPAEGKTPLQGNVSLAYDQPTATIAIAAASLATPDTRVSAAGAVGQSLKVSLHTTNLDDLLPALAMIEPDAPSRLPLKLSRGAASAELTVDGPLDSPRVAGHLALAHFIAANENFDALSADIDATPSALAARRLTLDREGMHVSGSGRLALASWRPAPAGAVSATLTIQGADIHALIARAGAPIDASGTASVTVGIQGTYAHPRAQAHLTADRLFLEGERFDRLNADLLYQPAGISVPSADLRLGPARVELRGAYTRKGSDWKNGRGDFQIATAGVALGQLNVVQSYHQGLGGQLALKAHGAVVVTNGRLDLSQLDSSVSVHRLRIDGSAIGDASLAARTRGSDLNVQLEGDLRGSRVHGAGQWRLEGDYPGRGQVHLTAITFATLHDLSSIGRGKNALPFQGSLDLDAVIAGPLKHRQQIKAEITIPHIEAQPPPDQRPRAGARAQNLLLHNTGPVRLEATLASVTIQSAHLVAEDTNVEATGRVTFDATSPWNVKVRGGINLSILQLFNRDLLAQGSAVLDTSIQGSLRDPNVNGRLELRHASLYFGDLPAGIDNANGVVLFNRSRAALESLTAEIGGGRVALGGFIGLSGGVALYRVQATANRVRIRYPEGVSYTLNAALSLTGTSENGLVTGSVTVLRAAFTPRIDLPGLLAAGEKPIAAPSTPNDYLSGVQFDVRIQSGPNLAIQSPLGRDLQAEADLRLRGNATHPVLRGDVSVNEGEIQFFGNKYNINRGVVHFINPTKIEPVFDVDLETKARGITVSISLSGTLNRLNITYRSDPPLQTSEIIALLAVGRDPTSNAGLASSQVASSQNNLLNTGAGTLSQALSAPVSSRLQRFFGVTRLKIDPLLTGVENIPEARLTWEQQVSPDITLTYITNLNRTSEQIVRVEWDMNRRWSAIAVRDENGVFGVDFQYRKHFK